MSALWLISGAFDVEDDIAEPASEPEPEPNPWLHEDVA